MGPSEEQQDVEVRNACTAADGPVAAERDDNTGLRRGGSLVEEAPQPESSTHPRKASQRCAAALAAAPSAHNSRAHVHADGDVGLSPTPRRRHRRSAHEIIRPPARHSSGRRRSPRRVSDCRLQCRRRKTPVTLVIRSIAGDGAPLGQRIPRPSISRCDRARQIPSRASEIASNSTGVLVVRPACRVQARDAPSAVPEKRSVATANDARRLLQSRRDPEDVRGGPGGPGVCGARRSGGRCSRSSCRTLRAPLRCAVPRQSAPVPPPADDDHLVLSRALITSTASPRWRGSEGQVLHRRSDPASSRPGNPHIARHRHPPPGRSPRSRGVSSADPVHPMWQRSRKTMPSSACKRGASSQRFSA